MYFYYSYDYDGHGLELVGAIGDGKYKTPQRRYGVVNESHWERLGRWIFPLYLTNGVKHTNF